jgi:DNA-binding CsgD family transcriptional regulator
MAELAVDRGRWDEAEAAARSLLALPNTANTIQMRMLTLVGRVRARRGAPDAWPPLDEALRRIAAGELQELVPLHAARAEAAWLDGDVERTRAEAEAGLPLAHEPSSMPSPWTWAELAFWRWRAGGSAGLPADIPEPYRLHAAGRYRDAAASWRSIGGVYEAALALADSGAEVDVREALGTFQGLGAAPMARRTTERLRAMGVRHIPRGPRPATRGNPGGLTERELEVLALLEEGLRNAEIADRLVVSQKTVDHHVSAILAKLGVASRIEAASVARDLGLQHGERRDRR